VFFTINYRDWRGESQQHQSR